MIRTYKDYFVDIYEAMVNISKFVESYSFETFSNDEKTIYAAVRAIEIMGEAAKNIPKSVQKNYPSIPWKDIAGMRDKLIHEYFGVKKDIVWKTATVKVPPLIIKFKEIIDGFEKDGKVER